MCMNMASWRNNLDKTRKEANIKGILSCFIVDLTFVLLKRDLSVWILFRYEKVMRILSAFRLCNPCSHCPLSATHRLWHQPLHTKWTVYIIRRWRTSIPLCSYNDSNAFNLCAIGTWQYLIPIAVRKEAVYRERWKTRTQDRLCKNGRTDENRI